MDSYSNFEKINFENNIFKNLFFKLGDLLHVCFEKFWNNKDNLKKNYFRKIEKKMLKMNFFPLGLSSILDFEGGGEGILGTAISGTIWSEHILE